MGQLSALVALISFFSLPELALSKEFSDYQLVGTTIKTQEKINENSLYSQKLTQKSKEDIERELLGTWVLSHSDRYKEVTTRMELTEYFVEGESEGIKGLVYRGYFNLLGLGEEIFCSRPDNVIFRNNFDINYLCFNKDVEGFSDRFKSEPTYLIGLKVLGDRITNGIIGIGENLSEAETSFYSDDFSLSGFREVIVDKPPSDIFSRIDALFDKFETQYREFFPKRTLNHQQSFEILGYYARFYPERNLYI